ncbi:hypothetical protein Y1Q_0002320 [Alligator mississippiensis]|uniref:Uncharacterized protein n=1 Tax=Alligator mississippiensis TaxID=8496 RepID=A0A151MGQ0_ALLMI|nr:hypothetical protein Y1Q_0002320 [Alligator mississippiensis]
MAESDYFLPSYHSLRQDRGSCWQDGQMDGKLPHGLKHAVHIYLDPEGLAWHILEPKEQITFLSVSMLYNKAQEQMDSKEKYRKKMRRDDGKMPY